MKGRVTVRLKADVLDVEGKAVAQALARLGFDDVQGVRAGRVFEVELGDASPAVARERLEAMARKLLANPVMETFTVEVDPK
jgi:phosphoribosylformylglycinamidine synthase